MVMGCEAYYITQANQRLIGDNTQIVLTLQKVGSSSYLIIE